MLELFAPGDEERWLASLTFRYPVRPRYCETDALGHVSNTVYPAYLELGRLQYLIAAGDPEPGPFAFAHVTAELTVRYVAACYYDEPLEVATAITALGRSSGVMEQAIAGAGDSLRAIARVAFVRSDGDRTMPWTAAQIDALEGFARRSLRAS